MSQHYLSKVILKNFQGFYGEYEFDISEKAGFRNILIYGENGSGKTSLYLGISGFFDIIKAPKSSKPITEFCNIFAKDDTNSITDSVEHVKNTKAELHFTTTNGNISQLEWDENFEGISNSDIKSACEKAIIATYNYSHILDIYYDFRRKDTEAINIGKLVITQILFDYPLGRDTVQERIKKINVWTDKINQCKDELDSLLEKKEIDNNDVIEKKIKESEDDYKGYIYDRDQEINTFNNLLEATLEELQQEINRLLDAFESTESHTKDGNLRIDKLEFAEGLSVDRKGEIIYPTIIPIVEFFGQTNKRFHKFLNEARISSVMMSILFAKYLMIPPAEHQIKLLVLDDVLIGIDINNRFRVLQILDKFFRDWQIFIMTYDRLWYEAVMRYSELNWNQYEMYAHVQKVPCPVVRKMSEDTDDKTAVNDYIKYLLNRAEYYLNNNYDVNAAGLYARISYETILKRFCVIKNIPVQYKWNIGKSYNMAGDFEKAIENYFNEKNDPRSKEFNLFEKLKKYKDILNNTAHSFDLDSKPEIEIIINTLKDFTGDQKAQPTATSLLTQNTHAVVPSTTRGKERTSSPTTPPVTPTLLANQVQTLAPEDNPRNKSQGASSDAPQSNASVKHVEHVSPAQDKSKIEQHEQENEGTVTLHSHTFAGHNVMRTYNDYDINKLPLRKFERKKFPIMNHNYLINLITTSQYYHESIHYSIPNLVSYFANKMDSRSEVIAIQICILIDMSNLCIVRDLDDRKYNSYRAFYRNQNSPALDKLLMMFQNYGLPLRILHQQNILEAINNIRDLSTFETAQIRDIGCYLNDRRLLEFITYVCGKTTE